MAPVRTRHILRELCPRGFRGPQAYRFSTGHFSRYTILTRSFGGRRFSPAFRRIAPRTRTIPRNGSTHHPRGRRKAKRQHAQRLLAWMVEAVLSGLPLGWLIAMQAFGAPDYPKGAGCHENSVWYTLEANAVPRMLGLAGYEPLPLRHTRAGQTGPLAQSHRKRSASGSPDCTAARKSRLVTLIGTVTEQPRTIRVLVGRCRRDLWPLRRTTAIRRSRGYVAFGRSRYGRRHRSPLRQPHFVAICCVQRKSCKSNLRAIVWTDNTTLFDPSKALGDPELPDGYWGNPANHRGRLDAFKTSRLSNPYQFFPKNRSHDAP